MSRIDSPIVDILSLINQIRNYEPNLMGIIFDYVFVPCSQSREGKHKYIRAIPTPGTTSICEKAFYNNNKLEWVIIDKTVESIGEAAFDECSKLTHLTIPDSVKSIGTLAFDQCSSLTRLIIPDSVKSIGKYAFSSCSSLTEASIPSHLESIVKENTVFPKNTKIIVR